MIYKTFNIIFFMLFCQSAICQNYHSQNFTRITYTMNYQLDSSNHEDRRTELMELLYNDSVSIFQSIGKGIKDSLNHIGRREKANYDVRYESIYSKVPRTRVHYEIQRKDDVFSVLDTYKYGGLRSDGYQLYQEKHQFDWEISEKTDSINNILVQQAFVEFGGRRWEAWFAPNIPISAGPYKFYGLPGLIVSIKDLRNTWEFKLNAIQVNIKRFIIDPADLPSTIVRTEKLKFFNDWKNYLENRTIIDESTGDIIVPSTEARKNSIEQDKIYAKKNNNWIELYP